MDYEQPNLNHQQPDYRSYTPETEQGSQDSLNLDLLVEPISQY